MKTNPPCIAILGRPNVGKSTLFNQLTGTRHAVVRDEPGVTRDVHRGKVSWCGYEFDLLDTAGVTDGGDHAWSQEIRRKALEAASSAHKIILVLDGKFGLNPEDRDLALYAQKLNKPVLAVVNKLDNRKNWSVNLAEFYELGFDQLQPASFEHKFGLDEVIDWVTEGMQKASVVDDNQTPRLACIGRPNAGKSTLVNKLLGFEQVVVSPEAGTTIDSIEVSFSRDGQDYRLVDTAGLRRRAKRIQDVERLSAYKTEDAMIDADLLLLVVDGLIGVTHQDTRIVELALEHHRGVILVINKTDEGEKKIPEFRKTSRAKIEKAFHFFKDIPVCFISAKTGGGVESLFKLIDQIWKGLNFKVSTREINDFFQEVIRHAPAPHFRGNDIKFLYITQTRQKPPSFITFVNEPRGVTPGYKRFVISHIKEHYGLKGIPVRLYAKKRPRGAASLEQ